MQRFCLQVAGFSFGAASRTSPLRFRLADSLAKFLVPADQNCGLQFDIVVQDTVSFRPDRVLFERPRAYAVGLDGQGNYLIRGWAQPDPPSVMQVNADFSAGTVQVPAVVAGADGGFYPLATMDIVAAINCLANAGDFFVHSAAISDNGRGYLFAGPSGAGKSTMADLWAQVAGAVVLGEDQNVVCKRDGRFWVFGGPWHNNPARCAPLGVPLAAVFLLDHAPQNRAETCRGVEAASNLVGNSYLPFYRREGLERTIEAVGELSQAVPVYRLAYRPDLEVIDDVRSLAGG